MAESSLSQNWSTYRRQIGMELGYGPAPDDYNSTQNLMVDDCRDRGIAQFYAPPPIDKGGKSHQWSFMRPMVSLSTIASTWEYPLPSEYGGICGPITFRTTSTCYQPITLTSDSNIRKMRETQPATTGIPQYVAVRWLPHSGTTGQRQELIFFPTPDAVYALQYQMRVNPNALSKEAPWPMGGMKHAETILASCLAIAELGPDGGGNGSRAGYFMSRLAASISQDSQDNVADNLGYMGDPSVAPSIGRYRPQSEGLVVSYNGTTY